MNFTFVVLFDVFLIITLVLCAWFSLTTPDLLRSVVLFIAFGLLVSLAWVRLQAPDVAMAEAAVGSGLTGALLLSTLSAMRKAQATRDDETLNDQQNEEKAPDTAGAEEMEIAQDPSR
jgi:energy-converting hydrogenase B subunit D